MGHHLTTKDIIAFRFENVKPFFTINAALQEAQDSIYLFELQYQ